MRALGFLAGLILLALLVVAAAGAVTAAMDRPPTAAELAREDAQIARYELEQAKLERQLALQQELYWLDTALAVGWRVLPLAAVVCGLVYLAARGAASARFRWSHVDPDARGLLPVPVDGLEVVGSKALGAFHAARQLEAAQQPVPHTLTYSPHTAEHYAPRLDYRTHAVGALGSPVAELPAPAGGASIPTFGELLDAGRLGRGQPLMLGVNLADGKPIEGAWLDVYSSALAGQPHSGKTTTQRFLAAQLALWGARFVVCDPHMEAGDDSLGATLDPLRGIYLCEPAGDAGDILEAVRFVDDIGRRRVKGDPDRTPIVLWVDELNGLLSDSTVGGPLLALLQETARAYRKAGVFISAVAHTWNASSTGGTTDLRANFASRLVHRTERQVARQLVPTDMAQKVERLEVGQAVLHSMRYSTVIQVPKTGAGDIARVAQLLQAPAPSVAPSAATSGLTSESRPIGFRPAAREVAAVVTTEGATASSLPRHQDAGNWTAEELRIIAALAEGKTPGQLAKEIAGADGGRAYKEAAARIAAVIARLAVLKGGA